MRLLKICAGIALLFAGLSVSPPAVRAAESSVTGKIVGSVTSTGTQNAHQARSSACRH